MKAQRVLGIMSGTSLDGVDYALCEIKGKPESIKLLKMWSCEYPPALKAKLLAAASDKLSSYEVAQLHHDLGRFYAAKAPQIKCDYVGLHGQTIFHNPRRPFVATSQIGEPAYLAAKFNVPVVNQFRGMDMALGGQGAPLATLFHRYVFGSNKLNVAVNNLGGISNVTYLPKDKKKILSFDTGPANMLIDYAVDRVSHGKESFDHSGKWSAQGIADPSLVQAWLKNSFFKKAPPKSTGREDFGPAYFEKTWKECKKARLNSFDTVATYTAFTAESIALNYALHLPHLPQLVVLCGGGAANNTLRKMIAQSLRRYEWNQTKGRILKPLEVKTSDELGWPYQSIEAAAFALLAFQTMNKKPGNLPETTGARGAAVLGQITQAPY